MSRTFKDRPYFVRAVEAMHQGRIDHDHRGPVSRWVPESPERRLFSIDIDDDLALKEAYRRFENRDDVILRTVMKRPYLIRKDYFNFTWSKSRIEFWVTYKGHYRTRNRFSEFCTDVEHYDARTGRDTRDGKVACCSPDVLYHGESFDRRPTSTTRRRASLGRIARRYNSGASVDDIASEDDFSTVDVCQQYGPPTYAWDD